MKLIQTIKQPVQARIVIPGSKSITNRALLLAALADGISELSGILLSDDTSVFIEALRELGVTIMLDKAAHTCVVGGAGGVFPKNRAHIWCGDAGTAARFLLAACASVSGIYQFDGSAQLRRRPIATLLSLLSSQGAKVIPEDAREMPLTIAGQGGLLGGEIIMSAHETGQYVSALLMVAPFAKTPIMLETENLVSVPYVNMTCSMMRDFGVLVKRLHQTRFYVPVPQVYYPQKYVIEPDLSTASYFFAAAAVTGGEMTVPHVQRETSMQADIQFLTVLEKMGCTVMQTNEGVTVKGAQQLRGVNVDMRDFSDVFMTLAAIAPFASSPTTITNIAHTRLKESDRITAMRVGLEKLGIKIETGLDWIKIYPGIPQAAIIDSMNDHRIAMSFSIVGLKVEGIKIDGAECVSKTCPEFFELWDQIKK